MHMLNKSDQVKYEYLTIVKIFIIIDSIIVIIFKALL